MKRFLVAGVVVLWSQAVAAAAPATLDELKGVLLAERDRARATTISVHCRGVLTSYMERRVDSGDISSSTLVALDPAKPKVSVTDYELLMGGRNVWLSHRDSSIWEMPERRITEQYVAGKSRFLEVFEDPKRKPRYFVTGSGKFTSLVMSELYPVHGPREYPGWTLEETSTGLVVQASAPGYEDVYDKGDKPRLLTRRMPEEVLEYDDYLEYRGLMLPQKIVWRRYTKKGELVSREEARMTYRKVDNGDERLAVPLAKPANAEVRVPEAFESVMVANGVKP